MSDNGRKRSRKSKLVPRDCADFVEDDSVLQEPAKKKLLLAKIKKEPDNFVPPTEAASHEFSVKVEVEDVEESVPEEDSSSYMQYLFSLSKDTQNTEPTPSFEFADDNLLLENKLTFEEDNSSYVDVKKVQKMLGSLHKKYPLEKEAVLYTRNQWGKVFNERYAFEFRKTPLDDQLQDVLKQWRNWTINTRAKESPFSYKCYICVNAWWSLTEFKTHLTIHDGCKLRIEIREQECNVIAYEGNIPGFQEVYVHGKCLKCAKTYDHHLTNRSASESFYSCNYCKDRFFTCTSLAKHEGTCSKNPIRVLSISQHGKEFKFSDFSCQVCNTVFLSNTDLNDHLVICHKVRSDEPIITKLKNCKLCSRSYYTYHYHICLKKNMVYECMYCNAKFQSKQMLENHLDMWNKVVRCRICDKFLMRGCMAGQHYALHSENFTMVHRCLVCKKKMKIFMEEEAMKQHKNRYHNRTFPKRPNTDVIIMAKIMLQQCMMDPNAKKTIPKILRAQTEHNPQKVKSCLATAAPAPLTAPPAAPISVDPKMTRGEPMQRVRVYAPEKDKIDNKNKNSDNEPRMQETTICHDDEVGKATEEGLLENDEVTIKKEKNDFNTNENKQMEDNNKVPENEVIEISNTAVKDENIEVHNVVDIVKSQQYNAANVNNVEIVQERDSMRKTESEGSKDLPKLMEELNEFLDIKPDIIRIKEENVSDDESKQHSSLQTSKANDITESDLSKVLQSSSTFAEEVTSEFRVFEHSKVFQVSKGIISSANIKQEIKKEPEDDDLIIVDTSNVVKREGVTSNSELSLLNLEPEIILKAGYRKRKVYKCSRCDYSGYHREYKEHLSNHCMKSRKDREKEAELIFKCTKCGGKYANIKRYALHFEKHGYRYMSCPQCFENFDCTTKLVSHLNNHVKTQFIRMQFISDRDDKDRKVYQCKTCKEVQNSSNYFVHWEKHLELKKEPVEEPVVEEGGNVEAAGEQALAPEALKRVIEHLTKQERSERERVKTCFICDRIFERRNDIKRHIIEHLLEDAFANMNESSSLRCQICQALHVKPDAYKKHMRDHASLPIYQCSLCNKTFSDSSNYTKHKKIHNLKAFVCDVCNKKFQAKISLEKHMEMHMTMAPIKCERCERVFHDRSFYKRHYRQYHQKLGSKFKCLICKDKFNCLREKWDHMWEVHKQRKHNADCPVCQRSYRKFSDVKKHAAEEHGIQVTASNMWSLLNRVTEMERSQAQGTEGEATGTGTGDTGTRETERAVQGLKEETGSSDDDCLIIEEERETLVVFD